MAEILLDEHVSGRVIGETLAADGHDVRSIDSEEALQGLPDEAVFEVAASERRVLVTANARHFVPLISEWTGGGRSHAGVILIPSSVRNENFGALVAGLRAALEATDQRYWIDRVEWLRKG